LGIWGEPHLRTGAEITRCVRRSPHLRRRLVMAAHAKQTLLLRFLGFVKRQVQHCSRMRDALPFPLCYLRSIKHLIRSILYIFLVKNSTRRKFDQCYRKISICTIFNKRIMKIYFLFFIDIDLLLKLQGVADSATLSSTLFYL
jgi:hypothetical protein